MRSELEWTAAMEAWAQETLSRSKPLTVRQLDIVTGAFQRAAQRSTET